VRPAGAVSPTGETI